MEDEVGASNVTRLYTLAGTNIAIFTFMLFFLYPRFESDRINPVLFQATLIAMGVATFSLVFATLQLLPLFAWRTDGVTPKRCCTRGEPIASGLWVTPCCSWIRA